MLIVFCMTAYSYYHTTSSSAIQMYTQPTSVIFSSDTILMGMELISNTFCHFCLMKSHVHFHNILKIAEKDKC